MRSQRRAKSRPWLVLRATALGSTCSIFANCSIHEHEPVVSDAGEAHGGKLGASGGTAATAGKNGGGAGAGGKSGDGPTSGGAATAEGGVAGAPDGEHAGASSGGTSGEGGGAAGASEGGGAGAPANEGGRASGGAAGRGSGGSAGGTVSRGGASAGGGIGGGGGSGPGAGGGGKGGATSCVAKDVGPEGPSCAGLQNSCGSGESCCTSLCVPGGLFALGGNVEARTSQAKVSGFYLDKYEVSVGRFRRFVSAYDDWRHSNPQNAAASHPLIAGSGWQATAWANALPSSSAAFVENVTTNCRPKHDGAYSTWSASGANDSLPINCLNWFEAFAFCAWDGGRLPTEAEWEYAAAGGDEGNVYPWGAQPPTSERASYDCLDGPLGCADLRAIIAVGSKPKGAGLFGHLDLAGSVQEWVLDWYSTPYPTMMNDDAVVASDAQHFLRVYRGSAWGQTADELNVAIRRNEEPETRGSYIGLRCARPSAGSL